MPPLKNADKSTLGGTKRDRTKFGSVNPPLTRFFEKLRWRRQDGHVFMWAFDLLELNGQNMRRERIEVRKATLARLLKKAKVGLQFNDHISVSGDVVLRHACALGLEGIVSKRLGSRYVYGRSRDWLKFKNPDAPAVQRELEEDWGRTR
jgi:bifunctional non-homologous end joining protein LigD